MNPALTETDRQLTAQDVGIWARVYSPLLWAHSMKSDRRDYELMRDAQTYKAVMVATHPGRLDLTYYRGFPDRSAERDWAP